MQKHYEVLIHAYGEIADDIFDEIIKDTETQLSNKISECQSPIDGVKISTKNIGKGADWLVLAMYFVAAAIVIPEAHKKIREGIEEWQRIYSELHSFFTRVIGSKSAFFPDEYLFLVAVFHLSGRQFSDTIQYKSLLRIPVSNPDLHGFESLLFSFCDNSTFIQVAVSRSGEVLWQNNVELIEFQANRL